MTAQNAPNAPNARMSAEQTPTEDTSGCGYQGYEFGAGTYPDSYCLNGLLHDADSDYLNDEEIPCPMCDREASIDWWFCQWKGMSEPGDDRPQEVIDAEYRAAAISLVDDIRLNRGIPLPVAGDGE